MYLVQDLLELALRDDLSFVLMSLNLEKAFNRIVQGYFTSTLRAFSFVPCFVGILQVLYASSEYLVTVNRRLMEPIPFR